MSFIAELKRRKVFKVGGAYLVVAWLAVQAVSIGFPAFDAPPWVLRVFILVAMLGFPIALLFAWVFDVTPDGVKAESASTRTSLGVYVAAAALAALAIGWYFKGQPSYRAGDVPASSGPSIAVLPFANMSGKADEEYFSDGMTEELLNVLAKIPKLNVAARTSVFEFKGKGGDVREIGRKLGVGHIVEGSVRREGGQVRVTAQLIRVADGFHVWSESYDRELKGVFALQDDIARHIGEQLKTSLGVTTPTAPVAARAPIDPAAYDEYLKGRELLRARKDMPGAIEHFKAALAKAPDFAAAWSSLSLTYEASFWYLKRTPAEQAVALAGEAQAAAGAAALAPDAAPSEHALANVARAQFHYADAEQHYLRAMRLDPGYSDVREDYAEVLFEVGRFEDARRAARELVTLDPYFIVGWNRVLNTAIAFDNRSEVDEALSHMQALGAFGRMAPLEYALAHARMDQARAALEDLGKQLPDAAAEFAPLMPWANPPAAGPQGLDATLAAAPIGTADFALIARGDVDRYNAYLAGEGAIPQAYYFANLASSKPAGLAMLRDARVKAKLIEYGFVAYWREKGWPAACRPLEKDDFECGIDVPPPKGAAP